VRAVVARLSETEKSRIRELRAAGLTTRLIGVEIGRADRTVWGYLESLR
jgi:IS30 family transposase